MVKNYSEVHRYTELMAVVVVVGPIVELVNVPDFLLTRMAHLVEAQAVTVESVTVNPLTTQI
jgi:hypothetical protein